MSNAFAPTVRQRLAPGDLGRIISLHGTLYAAEYGFDTTFEAYVAGPLAAFALAPRRREAIWLAESGNELLGCVAVVAVSESEAQLRWFLVAPVARGHGLGRRLLHLAVAFAEQHGYAAMCLWTVGSLSAAAHLYRELGFERTEQHPVTRWGVPVVEEKYVLNLPRRGVT